jgi:DNA sulfur modification protein DndC
MSYRKELLRKLLEAQKLVRLEDPQLELITPPELEEIRNAWMHDPNEPDWEDSLPKIYEEIMDEKRDWAESDAGAFTKLDADLLHDLEITHKVPAALVMKLIELELSMDALSKRAAVFDRIGQVLNRDWGSFETIIEKQQASNKKAHFLDQELASLKEQYDTFEKLKTNVA